MVTIKVAFLNRSVISLTTIMPGGGGIRYYGLSACLQIPWEGRPRGEDSIKKREQPGIKSAVKNTKG